MSWERALLVVGILALTVVYYGLAGMALRDLLRRPAVRGDNKVTWGLAIVCLPIVGALLYGYMGAASFLPRSPASGSNLRSAARSIAAKRPATRKQSRDSTGDPPSDS